MTLFGNRVRDYEIWGRIGEGGMSEVWLAKHAVLGLPVIIKTLRGTIADKGAIVNEARLMARISNPRVVRAIDAGVHEGTPYLVQEYVDGIDLAELDRRRRSSLGVGLPLWFVCRVMKDVCRALHAAHQVGVIHRDVKPSNIFGAPETGIRLGDFGLAVARADDVQHEVSGTLKFMAPEQLLGGAIERFTDVYGAGATAFDLRYGHSPFEEVDHILDAVRTPRFPTPQSPAEGYFQHLLGMMLHKQSHARPQDLANPARHFAMLARTLRPPGSRLHALCIDKNTFRIGGCTVTLSAGDIALSEVDGIVSSANSEMRMRSGVAEALRKRGGDVIEQEAMKGGARPLGSCVSTTAGDLCARMVLHAVSAWNEASCVGRAMQHVFLMGDEFGLKSLAIPALGTGVAKVSLETCASAMMTALKWHIALGGTRLESVNVVLADEHKLRVFREVADEALSDDDDAPPFADLGLPVESGEVRVDAATQIDAKSRRVTVD